MLLNPPANLKKHFTFSEKELVKLLTDAFNEGADYVEACFKEQHESEFDVKYQNKTKQESLQEFIKTKLNGQ